MTWAEVRLLLSVLDVRETAVCMLATVAGMPPGEIFGLKWRHVRADHIQIEQRLYRGQIDSPKTNQSKRSVALSQGLQTAIARWKRSLAIADLRSGCFPLRRGEPPSQRQLLATVDCTQIEISRPR